MKPTSAMAVIKKKGKILILNDRRGRWTLPGGQIDKGETPQKGAGREVAEETGLQINIGNKKACTKKYSKGKKKAVVFSAKVKKDKVNLSHEHNGFKWISPKKAMKMLIARHAIVVSLLV